jgi:integrase
MRGTVIKRGNTWSVVVEVGRDPTSGERVRKWHSGFKSKKEAERARTKLLSRLDEGTYVMPSRLGFGTFLENEWLPAKRSTVKATTLASYDMHVRKHIVPRLGEIRLLGLTAGHLNAFYGELLAEGRRDGKGGLSPTTVRRVHATIHKALADGVRWGRLPRNLADQADPPRAPVAEMSIWTPAQLRAFLESVHSDRLFAAWLLAATTGMRRGEILGLRWADIDMDSASATIRQIRTVAQYQVVTGSPKTDKGTRTVALDQATVTALQAHRVAQMDERRAFGLAYQETGDLVFTREDGSPIHPERFSSWFRQRCRRSGLPLVRLHDVRHSYVTALLAAGVSLKVVSQRVGHASPMVTMTIYQHVLPSDDRAAAAIGATAILGDL